MPAHEIKSADWTAFCERFLDLHRGAPMTVRKISLNGEGTDVVREMPLTKLWFEADSCNDRLFLDFEQDGRREIIHEIVDPIHVKLREEADGQKHLQIDAEDGCTMVFFRSGKLTELLEGVAFD